MLGHPELSNALMGVIGVIVTAFVIDWKRKTDTRLSKLENNYIREFQTIREAISNSTISQLQAMAEMEKRLSSCFVSRDLCESKMEAHDKL